MSLEKNKGVIERWIEAHNRLDIDAALACWADETHVWLRPAFNRFSAGFPDLHVTIDEMIVEGDEVVTRWTMTGTHRGVWGEIPATGKTVQWNATDIYTIVKSKIEALDRAADSLKLLKQLGTVLTWQDKVIQ